MFAGFSVSVEHSTTIGDTEDESTSVSVNFGDPDKGDEFVVDIYYDETYGTFIFHTVAGRSKCIHEDGTARSEDPRLVLSNPTSSFIYPEETMVFEVGMSNLGQSPDSLFYIVQEAGNRDLSVTADYTIVNENGLVIQLHNDKSVTKQIAIKRGYNKYEFPKLQLTLKSKCEADMNVRQNQIDGLYTTITLSNALNEKGEQVLKWMEPCPEVHWAGELNRDRHFLINTRTTDSLPVQIFNPRASSGKNITNLSTDGPLKEILFKYRPIGTKAWTTGLTKTPTETSVTMNYLHLFVHEDDYGISSLDWQLQGRVNEGNYEIVLETKCDIQVGPDEVKGFQENIITGTYDITRPKQYGQPAPLRQDIIIGEEISIYFNEEMWCQEPYSFDMEIKIVGTNYNLTKEDLLINCSGKKLGFQFDLSGKIEPSEIVGKEFAVEIGKLMDRNSNLMDDNIRFSKRFANLDLSGASTKFMFSMDNTTCTKESVEAQSDDVKIAIASMIGMDSIERLKVSRLSCQDNSTVTATAEIISLEFAEVRHLLKSDLFFNEEPMERKHSIALFQALKDTVTGKGKNAKRRLLSNIIEKSYHVNALLVVPSSRDIAKFQSSPDDRREEVRLEDWALATNIIPADDETSDTQEEDIQKGRKRLEKEREYVLTERDKVFNEKNVLMNEILIEKNAMLKEKDKMLKRQDEILTEVIKEKDEMREMMKGLLKRL